MAASGSYFAGANYRYLPTEQSSPISTDIDESDSRKRAEVRECGPASLPVNVPDWSKILKQDYKNHNKENHTVVEDSDDDEDGGGDDRIPPHEVLAMRRRMMTSFSVYEVMGRTLKVRDAIWEKTGFLD